MINLLKNGFKFDWSTPAGIVTVLSALVVVTPLCGFIFDCGCNWPWAGLDVNCNIHDLESIRPCPWCLPLWAGLVSTTVSITAAYVAAKHLIMTNTIKIQNNGSEFIIRVAVGMVVFLLFAFATGWIAEKSQYYFL